MTMTMERSAGKVLIVDDEMSVRRTIKRGLGRAGYDCTEAADAAEAVVRVREDSPEAVVLDVMMPGKSGRDLLPEILSAHPNMAVIMSTAVVDPKIIVDCMRLGAQDYITKPFELEELVRSVGRAVEMKRLERMILEHQRQLERTVDDQKTEIRRIFLNSVEALVHALEAKDRYTAGHSRRVTQLSVAIGRVMALPSDELEDLRWGALLHDVGKIAVDSAIQNKPGQLTPDEYQQMMAHSAIGAGIVRPLASQKTIDIIVHHHDHYNGSGLGQTVRGEDIPLGARIVAVADSFDAMVSDRPYRRAMALGAGAVEIRRCAGTQFDTTVVEAFFKTGADTGATLPAVNV